MNDRQALSGAFVLRETLFLSTSNVIAFGVTALTGIALARWLVPEEYGRLGYFVNLVTMVGLFSDLGLTLKLVNELAAAQSESARNRSFYTLLCAKLLVAVPLFVIVTGIGIGLRQPGYAIAGVIIVVSVFASSCLAALQGLQKTMLVALVVWIHPVAYLGLLLSIGASGAEQVLALFAAAHALSALATVGALVRGGSIRRPRRHYLSLHYMRAMVPASLDIYLALLVGTAYTVAPTLILGAAGLYVEAAYCAVVITLVRFVPAVIVSVLGSAMYPRLCADFALGGALAAQIIRPFYDGALAVGIAVSALFAFNAEFLLRLVYTTKYADVSPLLVLAAPLCLVLSLESWAYLIIVAVGRVRAGVKLQTWRLLAFVGSWMLLWVAGVSDILTLIACYGALALATLFWEIDLACRATGYIVAWRRTAAAVVAGVAAAIVPRAMLPLNSDPIVVGAYQAALTLVSSFAAASLCLFWEYVWPATRRTGGQGTSALPPVPAANSAPTSLPSEEP